MRDGLVPVMLLKTDRTEPLRPTKAREARFHSGCDLPNGGRGHRGLRRSRLRRGGPLNVCFGSVTNHAERRRRNRRISYAVPMQMRSWWIPASGGNGAMGVGTAWLPGSQGVRRPISGGASYLPVNVPNRPRSAAWIGAQGKREHAARQTGSSSAAQSVRCSTRRRCQM